jgi:hypothetical protein
MGRLAQVCKLPLRVSGLLRTPWIPQASSFLVHSVTGVFFVVGYVELELFTARVVSSHDSATITKTSQHHADALESMLSDCVLKCARYL